MRKNLVLSLFGVDPFRIGGNEGFACECARQLQQSGWESVLVFEKPPAEAVRDFLSLPNVRIECVGQLHRGGPASLAAVSRLLKRYRPAVLHLHFITFLSLYPWLGRAWGVRKIFFTDHGSWPEGHRIRPVAWWKRIIGRGITLPLTTVINVSAYGQRAAAGHGYLPSNRYQVIYNGVDLSRMVRDPDRGRQFRRRHGIPEDRLLILQTSWMIPEKGIDDLLKAARGVLSRFSRAHFVFAGEGAYRQQYMRDAAELGLSSHVTWTGSIQDPVQEGLFEAADVVCQMSRWEEVFGWTIAEAMTCEKPLVATRVGGIPELVEDEISGFLVARGDTAAMAERILSLLEDADLRQCMGKAGLAAVQSKFDLRRNVSKLLVLYGVCEARPDVE